MSDGRPGALRDLAVHLLLVCYDAESQCHGELGKPWHEYVRHRDQHHGQPYTFYRDLFSDRLGVDPEYRLDSRLYDWHERMHQRDRRDFYCQYLPVHFGNEPGQCH